MIHLDFLVGATVADRHQPSASSQPQRRGDDSDQRSSERRRRQRRPAGDRVLDATHYSEYSLVSSPVQLDYSLRCKTDT